MPRSTGEWGGNEHDHLWQWPGRGPLAAEDALAFLGLSGLALDTANPVGGSYGIRTGDLGRFGSYVPPVMELPGLAEVEHTERVNRMQAH